MKKVYIDSNVFLNPVLYKIEENEEANKANDFLKRIISKQLTGITSVLTWNEFTWIIKRELGKEIAIEKGNYFLMFPNVFFKNISLKTIKKANDLFSKYNIRPRDAIHCACALENDVNVIISFDADFDAIDEIIRQEPS